MPIGVVDNAEGLMGDFYENHMYNSQGPTNDPSYYLASRIAIV